MDNFIIGILVIIGVFIIGLIAYLSGKIRALQAELRKEKNKKSLQEPVEPVKLDSVKLEPITDIGFGLFSSSTQSQKFSPKANKLYQKLDKITDQLDLSLHEERPQKGKRELLQKQYTIILRKFVDELCPYSISASNTNKK